MNGLMLVISFCKCVYLPGSVRACCIIWSRWRLPSLRLNGRRRGAPTWSENTDRRNPSPRGAAVGERDQRRPTGQSSSGSIQAHRNTETQQPFHRNGMDARVKPEHPFRRLATASSCACARLAPSPRPRYLPRMTKHGQIEKSIATLSNDEIKQLAAWFDELR